MQGFVFVFVLCDFVCVCVCFFMGPGRGNVIGETLVCHCRLPSAEVCFIISTPRGISVYSSLNISGINEIDTLRTSVWAGLYVLVFVILILLPCS